MVFEILDYLGNADWEYLEFSKNQKEIEKKMI